MKRTLIILLAIIVMTISLGGCAQKKAVTTLDEATRAERDAAREESAKKADEGLSIVDEDVTSQEMETVAKSPDMAVGKDGGDIFFEFDEYTIKEAHKTKLMELSDWLLKSKGSVTIEGHCDERGTNEYNLGLGDRRTHAVAGFLLASGVPKSRISTISRGEERPQCEEHTTACWSKNRRAHFVLSAKGK